MRLTRTTTVYLLLLAAWIVICAWQLFEHNRAKLSAREALTHRARDISYSLAAVIRSQGRFFRLVRQSPLEAALEALAKSHELLSVALLNARGEVVASAGRAIPLNIEDLPSRGVRWEKDAVTFINLIDLGSEIEDGRTSGPPAIIITSEEGRPEFPGGGPGGRRFPQPVRQLTERTSDAVVLRVEFPPDTPTTGPGSIAEFGEGRDRRRSEPGEFRGRRGPEPGESRDRRGPDFRPAPPRRVSVAATSAAVALVLEFPPDVPTTGPGAVTWPFPPERGDFSRSRRPPPFGRPPWMDEEGYRELLQKQGLHGFVLTMSAGALRAEIADDMWLRLVITVIALVAAVGLGLAWRNLDQSARLQMRLVRAQAINAQLREMNVAAAGLAHETRNPLNIVRGLAQMVSQQGNASTEIRAWSREITEEVDRVTGRLNEFLDYSRPREAKPAPTNLHAVVRDVERALATDIEDKNVQFLLDGPDLIVEADESLLRQVLFNLILNAVQAVNRGGKVEVAIERLPSGEARFDVRDDGSGVREEAREEIFRPYYTTHEGGTGLGLAVVRQIALAHRWDIEYIPTVAKGACFRVSGLYVVSRDT